MAGGKGREGVGVGVAVVAAPTPSVIGRSAAQLIIPRSKSIRHPAWLPVFSLSDPVAVADRPRAEQTDGVFDRHPA